jgi:hypothetical protein
MLSPTTEVFRVTYIFKTGKESIGDSYMNREAVEGQELNTLMANVFHSSKQRMFSKVKGS